MLSKEAVEDLERTANNPDAPEYTRRFASLLWQIEQLDPEDPDFPEQWNRLEAETYRHIKSRWEEDRLLWEAKVVDLMEQGGGDDPELLNWCLENLELHQHPPAPPMFFATPRRTKNVEYPLDKVNAQIWSLLEEDTSGQLALRAERSGSGRPLNIYYAIDFDALEDDIKISRRLTAYDKRAYISISALFNAGNTVMTMTQIYYAMGYTGKPGRSDLEKINMSITKMSGARIYVNNEQEAGAYSYDRFVYDGSLLPAERGTALTNGHFSDAAIHLFREPPVISFAKQRRQITTIDVKLLQSPLSKTDKNLMLDDYLIERIARARNKKKRRTHRILFKTLFEKAGATTPKQRQRLPEKAAKYLDHYRQCGMIVGYEMDPDGITVHFEGAPEE